ncbi:putative EP400-like protein isoform X3 [Chlorocebus sabaeus]|uniref:putative EP400-like protein isoform X3 n=1 Tax=Chlorocebus sabaeus TaxID=60711 RepID=UPI003BF9EED9
MQRISSSQSGQHHVQWPRACPGTGEEQPACSQPPPPLTLPSPSHQPQQLMVRGGPAGGQNMHVALQGMGPGLEGIPQVTLAPLTLPSPTSPGFQFGTQPWQFEHGSPSYIQVTSPLSQQVQTQSPTQPGPGPGQALQNVRAGAPGPGLGLCSSSPTGGFVDASVLVRQISLSPSSGGHFVFQDGPGLTQITQGAQVQLQHPGTPITVRERRPSQPHTQSGGTIHHLGPQSPAAAGGAGLQPLASPSHITTANLPPQISSIIQGQLVQQQQVLQGPPLSRPLGFKRTPGVLLPGAGGAAGFGMTSPPPTSPSRTAVPPGLSSLPLTSVGNVGVKKAPKKLEEIPPASPEMVQMRKQCLDYHYQEMQALKEVFKEYLIELFFLQHFQGNMMDFLAFKERLYGPLQAYLRQNDLDIEEEEEEHFEVINDEVKVVARKHGQPGTPVAIATQLPPRTSAAFPAQQQPLQENQVHQCVAELRKAGVWSQRHLPKLQEAPQPKSHWCYLLEEMQWVATDFAQERRWKVASVKKMVRAVARQLQDRTRRGRDREGGAEQAETDGTSTTREIQHSWSSTAQEHLIRLQEQKLQLPPPPLPPQTLPGAPQPTTQVQVQSPPPTTAEPPAHGSGPRALVTDSTSHLQGPRLMSVLMSQMAQVALATPPVVSVLAVAVLSARVTEPPATQQDQCCDRTAAESGRGPDWLHSLCMCSSSKS